MKLTLDMEVNEEIFKAEGWDNASEEYANLIATMFYDQAKACILARFKKESNKENNEKFDIIKQYKKEEESFKGGINEK